MSANTDTEPLRTAYSRDELADRLDEWMVNMWGNTPNNLDPDERNQWHRDNGLLYHFIRDHFPKNASILP